MNIKMWDRSLGQKAQMGGLIVYLLKVVERQLGAVMLHGCNHCEPPNAKSHAWH